MLHSHNERQIVRVLSKTSTVRFWSYSFSNHTLALPIFYFLFFLGLGLFFTFRRAVKQM